MNIEDIRLINKSLDLINKNAANLSDLDTLAVRSESRGQLELIKEVSSYVGQVFGALTGWSRAKSQCQLTSLNGFFERVDEELTALSKREVDSIIQEIDNPQEGVALFTDLEGLKERLWVSLSKLEALSENSEGDDLKKLRALQGRIEGILSRFSKNQDVCKVVEGLYNRYQDQIHEKKDNDFYFDDIQDAIEPLDITDFEQVDLTQEELLEASKEVMDQFDKTLSEHPNMAQWLMNPDTYKSIPEIANSYGAFSRPGEGPTLLGKLYSIRVSLEAMARGLRENKPSMGDIPGLLRFPGKQFSNGATRALSSTLNRTITKVDPSKGFDTSFEFIDSSQQDLSLNDFLSELPSELNGKSLYIPFVLGNVSLLERSHIVVIMVKNGTLYYYDSKGVMSDKKLLGPKEDKKPLRDYLEAMKTKYTLDRIVENVHTNQLDCHHCGAFVQLYIFATSVLGLDPEKYPQEVISNASMESFREALAKDYEYGQEALKNKKPLTGSIEERNPHASRFVRDLFKIDP